MVFDMTFSHNVDMFIYKESFVLWQGQDKASTVSPAAQFYIYIHGHLKLINK